MYETLMELGATNIRNTTLDGNALKIWFFGCMKSKFHHGRIRKLVFCWRKSVGSNVTYFKYLSLLRAEIR